MNNSQKTNQENDIVVAECWEVLAFDKQSKLSSKFKVEIWWNIKKTKNIIHKKTEYVFLNPNVWNSDWQNPVEIIKQAQRVWAEIVIDSPMINRYEKCWLSCLWWKSNFSFIKSHQENMNEIINKLNSTKDQRHLSFKRSCWELLKKEVWIWVCPYID